MNRVSVIVFLLVFAFPLSGCEGPDLKLEHKRIATQLREALPAQLHHEMEEIVYDRPRIPRQDYPKFLEEARIIYEREPQQLHEALSLRERGLAQLRADPSNSLTPVSLEYIETKEKRLRATWELLLIADLVTEPEPFLRGLPVLVTDEITEDLRTNFKERWASPSIKALEPSLVDDSRRRWAKFKEGRESWHR